MYYFEISLSCTDKGMQVQGLFGLGGQYFVNGFRNTVNAACDVLQNILEERGVKRCRVGVGDDEEEQASQKVKVDTELNINREHNSGSDHDKVNNCVGSNMGNKSHELDKLNDNISPSEPHIDEQKKLFNEVVWPIWSPG